MLIRPGEEFDISKVMFSIKKQFSHDVNRVMGFNSMYPNKPKPKADKRLSAFGYGMDEIVLKHQKFINNLKNQFQQKYPNGHPFPKFQWHESFRDHYIRNDDDFDDHWEYIKRNLEKHNLPQNWPYIFLNDEYEDLIDDCL